MEIDLGRSAGDQDFVLIFIKVLPGFQWVIRRPARSSTIRGIRPAHFRLPAGNAARNRARDLEFTSENRELGTQEIGHLGSSRSGCAGIVHRPSGHAIVGLTAHPAHQPTCIPRPPLNPFPVGTVKAINAKPQRCGDPMNAKRGSEAACSSIRSYGTHGKPGRSKINNKKSRVPTPSPPSSPYGAAGPQYGCCSPIHCRTS